MSVREELLSRTVARFAAWLETSGPYSWDHQSYYAGPIGRRAKELYYKHPWLGTLAVSPMVFCEAFVPEGKRLFHGPMRFPIADAHYAMAFGYLSEGQGNPEFYRRAIRLLEELVASRCPAYQEYCWGYPFDWVTSKGIIKAGTPLITTTPYAYEAFLLVYQLDGDKKWRSILDSIVRHALTDIRDFPVSRTASACSYTPFDTGGEINASAYRAFLLASAAVELDRWDAIEPAKKNLYFVLESQRPDGSWFYSNDGVRNFIDHTHTCFVLKALAKIERLIPDQRCREAIDRGVEYYLTNLFDEQGLPIPFSRRPRLTVYRRELNDYGECLNLCLLLRDRNVEMNRVLNRVLEDIMARWLKRDGSFRSRELLLGWDNVPMHRWGQSQVFRSLARLLREQRKGSSVRTGGEGKPVPEEAIASARREGRRT